MFVPFENLPANSRLWVFQGERKFNAEEITIIEGKLQLFTNEWAAHGQPLQSSYQIRDNRFIILATNESFQQPSGCSIDSSVYALKEIAQAIGQDLFRRDLVSFKKGDAVETIVLSELKNAFKSGIWDENTLTFNTLVTHKAQLEHSWLVAAKDTWLKRYIVKEEITH